MSLKQRYSLMSGLALALLLIITLPTVASLNAAEDARPLQTHDFVDVPVADKEWMEPYINEFYHQGITGGCANPPLQFCPEASVTRAELAVFMGRALGYLTMGPDGYTAEAYFKNTAAGSTQHGIVGRSVDGNGVVGMSDTQYGVYGSSGGIGVFGATVNGTGTAGFSTNSYGVSGISTNHYGVRAFSTNGTALLAQSNLDTFADLFYDMALGGSYGELFAERLRLVSNGDVVVELDQNNNTSDGFYVNNGANSTILAVHETSGTHVYTSTTIHGNFAVAQGYTKSALVDTVHYGERLMYAVESPENWFEDFGSAQLVDGEVIIEIDAMFAETVNLGEEYHVYLTPIGEGAVLYVDEQTPTSFVVRSTTRGSDIRFHYRIVAKRLGFEDVRMEAFGD